MAPLRTLSRERRPWTTRLRHSRVFRVALVLLVVLVIIGVILDRGLDAPLRAFVERRMNQSLVGYSARVDALDFHLLDLSLELKDVTVVQQAHPDPPVLQLPHLEMGVSWRDLLYLRLAANAVFERPSIYANLIQLHEENRDAVPLRQRGWQEALESIYPLKINELRIRDGSMTYQDDAGSPPLHLSGVELVAGNIRNIRSPERQYPSTVHAEGWVFDVGRAVIEGHANFLAEPTPGVKGTLHFERVELSYFEPLAQKLGLTVRQGFVSANGRVEVAPGVQIVEIESVVITAAEVDYLQNGAATPQAREAGVKIAEATRYALSHPEARYHVAKLRMDNGTLGIVNREHAPPYRLFFSNADLEVTNVSSRAEDGPAEATLHGAFMGSGSTRGTATLYPGDSPHFEAKIAVEKTQLRSLNDMLRATGKFDVTEGTFSVYSEVEVQDGRIRGYVKPLFADVEVYDAKQDKDKNVFRKMYEGIVEGMAHLLENRRGDVVTVTSLEGPVDDPKANTMQVIRGLLKNAFVKAILPGFYDQIARVDPVAYRAAKKKGKKADRAALN